MTLLSVHYPHHNTIQHFFMSAAQLNQSSSSRRSRTPLHCKQRDSQASSFFPLPFLTFLLLFFLFFLIFFFFFQNLSAFFFLWIAKFCSFGINMFFGIHFTLARKIFPQQSLKGFETELISLSLLLQLWPILNTFWGGIFFFHLLAGSSSLKLFLKC